MPPSKKDKIINRPNHRDLNGGFTVTLTLRIFESTIDKHVLQLKFNYSVIFSGLELGSMEEGKNKV